MFVTKILKKKLSEINKGKNNPQFGKKWTKELKEKRQKETIGDKNPNYGRKSPNRKTIGMYDLQNILIEKFNSIREAYEKLKLMKHLFLEYVMEDIKKQEDLFGNSYQIRC